jgi:hypothetical protein
MPELIQRKYKYRAWWSIENKAENEHQIKYRYRSYEKK